MADRIIDAGARASVPNKGASQLQLRDFDDELTRSARFVDLALWIERARGTLLEVEAALKNRPGLAEAFRDADIRTSIGWGPNESEGLVLLNITIQADVQRMLSAAFPTNGSRP